MSYPVILLVGQAASGKDTVADIIGGQKIALADPMKRIAAAVFGFTEDQLWGPSGNRNAPDPTWGHQRLEQLRKEVISVVANHDHCVVVDYSDHCEVVDCSRDCFLPRSLRGTRVPALLARLLDSKPTDTWSRFNTWLLDVLDHALAAGELTPRYVLQTLGTEFGRSIDTDLWINEGLSIARRLLCDGRNFYERGQGLGVKTPDHKTNLVVISDGRFRNEILAVKAAGGMVIKVVRPGASGIVGGGARGHASEAEQQTVPEEWFDAILYNDGDLTELGRAARSMGKALVAPFRLQASNFRPVVAAPKP